MTIFFHLAVSFCDHILLLWNAESTFILFGRNLSLVYGKGLNLHSYLHAVYFNFEDSCLKQLQETVTATLQIGALGDAFNQLNHWSNWPLATPNWVIDSRHALPFHFEYIQMDGEEWHLKLRDLRKMETHPSRLEEASPSKNSQEFTYTTCWKLWSKSSAKAKVSPTLGITSPCPNTNLTLPGAYMLKWKWKNQICKI